MKSSNGLFIRFCLRRRLIYRADFSALFLFAKKTVRLVNFLLHLSHRYETMQGKEQLMYSMNNSSENYDLLGNSCR